MMDIGRRVLFNSLRMNWLSDSSLKVEAWQVEDYRALSADEIYQRLNYFDLGFDRTSFVALAEDVDSPEEFCDALMGDVQLSQQEEDQVYLLIFELWRRFITDKPCLSVFCDELDHLIFAYDQGDLSQSEQIQDAITNLEVVLDENADEGVDPITVFETISNYCANDLETFLYDYILVQIDHNNFSYAFDLLDSFEPYLKDRSWFEFLRAKLLVNKDPISSNQIVKTLIKEIKETQDLDLGLELLSFLAKGGDPDLFKALAKQTVSMLETEDDFQELLSITSDFYHFLDKENLESAVVHILQKRSKYSFDKEINPKDADLGEYLKNLK